MCWQCNDCGENFETPFYRKSRHGIKISYCPACGSYDIDEDVEVDDTDYSEFIEWEELPEE